MSGPRRTIHTFFLANIGLYLANILIFLRKLRCTVATVSQLNSTCNEYGPRRLQMVTENSGRQWLTPTQWLDQNPGLIGRTNLYGLVNSGEIPSIRIGKKILIPADALDRMFESETAVTT